MNKKDITFFKDLIKFNNLESKIIYTDDVSIASNVPNKVFFLLEKEVFDMELSKEEAVKKRFIETVKKYQEKGNKFSQRFVDEYIYNEKKYKEEFAKEYDKIKAIGWTTELIDNENVIIILNKPKKVNINKSIVFMKEDLEKPIQEYRYLAYRDKYCWTCNKNIMIDKKRVMCEDISVETEELPYPILDLNYYPKKTDKLEFCFLTPKQTARFRKLKTHRFVGSAQGKSIGILINKCIAGVIGYNQVFTTFYGSYEEYELFLQFSIACTPFNRKVRMNKLINKIALWKKTAHLMLNDYEKEKYTHIVSTAITPYPECKHSRRLMKLKNRRFDEKTKMYNLVYECKMTEQKDLQEIFDDWMKKEKL